MLQFPNDRILPFPVYLRMVDFYSFLCYSLRSSSFLTTYSPAPQPSHHWLTVLEGHTMSTVDAFELFFQVMWMMVGTPIIGIPLASALSILLAEQVAWRRRIIRNY